MYTRLGHKRHRFLSRTKDGRWRRLYKCHPQTVAGKRIVLPNCYILSKSNGNSFHEALIPVANASKLYVLTCAIMSLDGLDPSGSSLLRRLEMLVLP